MKFVERKIIFHGSYFADFYLEQSPKVQEKIEFVFHLIRKVERVSRKFLSQIEGTDGCMKSEWSIALTFTGFSVVSMKEVLWSYSMVFRRKHKKHPGQKSKRLKELKMSILF